VKTPSVMQFKGHEAANMSMAVAPQRRKVNAVRRAFTIHFQCAKEVLLYAVTLITDTRRVL
jgi:hypothetical protein